MNRKLVVWEWVGALAAPLVAFAHHSFEMFDPTKEVEVTGTVVRVVRERGKTIYTLELETGEPTKPVNCDCNEPRK